MSERSLCKNVAYLSVFNNLYIKTNMKRKYLDNTSKFIYINKLALWQELFKKCNKD